MDLVDTPEYGRNLHAAGERTHRMNEPSGSANMYMCIYVYIYVYNYVIYVIYAIYIYESYDYKIRKHQKPDTGSCPPLPGSLICQSTARRLLRGSCGDRLADIKSRSIVSI